ncbi:MAG: metallophosphoesterase [Deltaproteobacteria bacterium]|nr:metallophosphoesterase [Deltaproteobacteria bacterium]
MKFIKKLPKRISIVLLLFIFSCNEPSSESNETIYFVQLSDIHLGKKEHYINLIKAIDSINHLPFKIEFVAVTGDIFSDNIQQKKIREQGNALKKLKFPLFVLPGNHDINPDSFDDDNSYFTHLFGPHNTYTDINETRFVFLFSEVLRRPLRKIESHSLVEMISLLSTSKKKIIFHHAPMVPDFYKNSVHEVWHRNQKIWKIIRGYTNVIAVITGHLHRCEIHNLDGVNIYSGPSIATYWGRQSSYRIYKLANSKISYSTVYLR